MPFWRSLSQAVESLLRRFGQLSAGTDTAQFLNLRNARITAQESGSKSFYTVKLYPETDVQIKDETLHIQVKLLPQQQLRVSVYSHSKQQMIADVTAPIDDDSDVMNLTLGNIYLKLEVDADPSMRTRH